ncbi:hypothetical protein Tco_0848426 [Tanacetum coccineum]
MVTLEEIKEAVWDCGSSKAPGPGWSNNPTLITDFCPISLIGIHYKIIAKILANRLSKVIDKIVSKEQSAFIAGRQILDGPVILSEIIECFGFGNKWCSWIKVCLNLSRKLLSYLMVAPTSDVSLSVVLGKEILYLLSFSSWLWKVSIMLLRKLWGNGLITGVNIKNSTINVSILFLCDDVIITTDWKCLRPWDNIIRVLHVFYLASGLKINIHKSNIYGIGINKDEVLSMASNAGCMAGDVLFNYLGLPIGSNMKSIASWEDDFSWYLLSIDFQSTRIGPSRPGKNSGLTKISFPLLLLIPTLDIYPRKVNVLYVEAFLGPTPPLD